MEINLKIMATYICLTSSILSHVLRGNAAHGNKSTISRNKRATNHDSARLLAVFSSVSSVHLPLPNRGKRRSKRRQRKVATEIGEACPSASYLPFQNEGSSLFHLFVARLKIFESFFKNESLLASNTFSSKPEKVKLINLQKYAPIRLLSA